MPFDGIFPRIATPSEWRFASYFQRRRMLAFALRNLPASHFWHFPNADGGDAKPKNWCGTAGCALGLMDALGWHGAFEWNEEDLQRASDTFCAHHQSDSIYGCKMIEVTSAMVADKLDLDDGVLT